MNPKESYVQSNTRYQTDLAAQARSANMCIKIINDRRELGLNLADLCRRIMPRLSIKALESILCLGRQILTNKYETAEKYGNRMERNQ